MALRMVCHHHGRAVSGMEIREACAVPYGDLSLLALSRGATRLGLAALPLDIPLSELNRRIGLPLIVHVHDGHFIVLYGLQGEDLLIADPARGKLRVPRHEFAREWLGSGTLQALRTEMAAGALSPGKPATGRSDLPLERATTGWSVTHWIRLILEGLTLWLLLTWVGTLFAHIQPSDISIGLPLAISLLLAFSWLALQAQWRRQSRAFREAYVDAHPFRPDTFQEVWRPGLVIRRILDLPWHARRAGMRFQGPRFAFLFILLLVFLAQHAAVFALAGAGAVLLLFMYHFWGKDRRHYGQVQRAERHRAALQTILRAPASAIEADPGQADDSWRRPSGATALAMVLASASAVVVAWKQGLSPDGVLVLFPVLVGSVWTFSRWLDARNALALADYRTLPPDTLSDEGPDPFPVGASELRYRTAGEHEASVRVPAGSSVLILLREHGEGAALLERLSARTADEGARLFYGNVAVDKSNRRSLQRRMVIVRSDGTVSGVPDFGIPAGGDDRAMEDIRAALRPSGVDIRQGRQRDVFSDALVKALRADPEILLLDACFRGMDPFQELIVLENLLLQRKGKTTVIASVRDELIPSVDLVLRPDMVPPSGSPSHTD